MKKFTLMTFVVLFVTSATFSQKHNSLNLKKGQKYIVENKINSHTTTDIQGQSMENISDINSTYNIEVGDIKDSISLTNTISGIKLVMTQMGQEITFDSEKTEDLEGPIGGALKEVIKKPQAVTISKTGKVAPIPEGANEEENMILKQMGDFNASGYGASMAFGTVPENAKVGTTWTDATEEDGTVRSTTYTVKSINGDLATLDIAGTASTELNMTNQGMEMTVKSSGKFTGEQVINVKTGVIQSNITKVDSEGTVSAMGQEFPTVTKLTSTTTVKAQ